MSNLRIGSKINNAMRKSKIIQKIRKIILYTRRWNDFKNDFQNFWSLGGGSRFALKWADRYPCLEDKTAETSFDAHYIYHPAWAARILAKTVPPYHVDISSTLNFCTIVSAFIPVRFYDYRPARLNLEGLLSDHVDLLSLPFDDESISSLSCMHVVEHIGLGRYGDVLDPGGDIKAITELTRVLAKGGNLLFVIPVGKPTIRFNAHRIYSYGQIETYFYGLNIRQFSLVDDKGQFIVDAEATLADQQKYGCGCWWFTK
jgi:SAM-dependent methyltransferase